MGLTPELRPSAGNNLFVFALPPTEWPDRSDEANAFAGHREWDAAHPRERYGPQCTAWARLVRLGQS